MIQPNAVEYILVVNIQLGAFWLGVRLFPWEIACLIPIADKENVHMPLKMEDYDYQSEKVPPIHGFSLKARLVWAFLWGRKLEDILD